MLSICTVIKMSNIAVVFSDVTECSGSDRCGSIKPFALREIESLHFHYLIAYLIANTSDCVASYRIVEYKSS